MITRLPRGSPIPREWATNCRPQSSAPSDPSLSDVSHKCVAFWFDCSLALGQSTTLQVLLSIPSAISPTLRTVLHRTNLDFVQFAFPAPTALPRTVSAVYLSLPPSLTALGASQTSPAPHGTVRYAIFRYSQLPQSLTEFVQRYRGCIHILNDNVLPEVRKPELQPTPCFALLRCFALSVTPE
jgi:hypothetical protein